MLSLLCQVMWMLVCLNLVRLCLEPECALAWQETFQTCED